MIFTPVSKIITLGRVFFVPRKVVGFLEKISGLDFKIKEMAIRIRELREVTRFTPAEMAEKTCVSVEEYLKC